MNRRLELLQLFVLFFLFAAITGLCFAQDQPGNENAPKVQIQWGKVTHVSQTILSLQVVVNPPLRRGSSIHDNAFQTLRETEADYVRYVPWLPYPKLAVAELEPPAHGKTSWDFTLIDPMTIDFLDATKGHPVMLNFSTIPQWMYKSDKPNAYPADPDKPTWNYESGTELRDQSMKEVGEYYGRLFSWYTDGGFTDEYGKRHESGYHYSIPLWEVLNEVDFEHHTKPETYTRMYDSIVESIRKVKPETKFVGTGLGAPGDSPEFFEYFLNPKNHNPGIPLDYISYHFYSIPSKDQGPNIQEHLFFAQAEGFVRTVGFIENIRKRLSPNTKTAINEIGAISADDDLKDTMTPIPNSYWNLVGANYAYLFGELTKMGIDIVSASQLVGYPTQFPSVSLVDWTTGKPNARLWVLRLLKDNFSFGDKVMETRNDSNYIYSLGFTTKDGKRKVLVVNKRNREMPVTVPGANGGQVTYVDQTTALQPPAIAKLTRDVVNLGGFSVAVVTLP